MRSFLFACGAAVCLANSPAYSDVQDCQFLLSQGLSNHIEIRDQTDYRRVDWDSFCSSESKRESGGFNVQYAGVGVGVNGQRQIANAMCRQTSSDTELRQLATRVSSNIDPNLMNVIAGCIDAAKGGLSVKQQISQLDNLTLTFSYAQSATMQDSVELRSVRTNGNITCDGELHSALEKGPVKVDRTASRHLYCHRTNQNEEYEPDGKPKSLRGGLVQIDTPVANVIGELPSRFAQMNPYEERLRKVESTLKRLDSIELPLFEKEGTFPIAGSEQYAFCSITKISGLVHGTVRDLDCDLTNPAHRQWTIKVVGSATKCRVTCFRFSPIRQD
jgi:hypothetical protein